MSGQLLDQLVDTYYESRPNLQMAHSPLCVFFFACSGSGKSTTRRLLVDKLGATYACNDEVRELLEKYPEATTQNIALKDIVAGTVERIYAEAPNKLIIFDNNIIQYYMHSDSYLNVARANNRPVFIIGLEASRRLLVQRIKDRGVNVAHILSELPGQLQDYKKATHDLTPDWILSPDGKNELQDLVTYLQDAGI